MSIEPVPRACELLHFQLIFTNMNLLFANSVDLSLSLLDDPGYLYKNIYIMFIDRLSCNG